MDIKNFNPSEYIANPLLLQSFIGDTDPSEIQGGGVKGGKKTGGRKKGTKNKKPKKVKISSGVDIPDEVDGWTIENIDELSSALYAVDFKDGQSGILFVSGEATITASWSEKGTTEEGSTTVPINLEMDIDEGTSQEEIEEQLIGLAEDTGLEDDIKNDDKDVPEWVFQKALGYITFKDIDIKEVQVSLNDEDETDEEMFKELISLNSVFNELIPNNVGDCVYEFMKNRYKKYSPKNFEGMRTTNDIYNWCKEKNIRMIAYDITGKVIKQNNPDVKNKQKNCIYVCYSNHLYPLKNTVLHKTPKKVCKKITYCDNIEKELEKTLHETKEYPDNILFDFLKRVVSYNENDRTVVKNPDFYLCKKILSMYGLSDKITPYTNLKTISNIILPLYLKENITSFLPKSSKYVKSGCYYNKYNIEPDKWKDDYDYDDIDTIDKNKCYAYVLKNLPYVIKTDIRCMEWTDKVKEITPHYLYVVKPKLSSILLPHTTLYTGSHILNCIKEGLEMTILEQLETKFVKNPFTAFINDLYERVKEGLIDEISFKQIVNITIGKFENNRELTNNYKVVKVCNTDEALKTKGYEKIRICKGWYALMESRDRYTIKNMKPIAIQVKDGARWLLYKTMKRIGLRSDDILQIKTDSITFIKNNNLKLKLDMKDRLNGWKKEDYKELSVAPPEDLKELSLQYKNNNENELGMCYAGSGKSYKIINEIIPKLDKSYIVLTPSHSCLKDYRLQKLNCSVIQRYVFTNKIPEEDIIIIDEFGMVDRMGLDVIYKCFLAQKKIIAYGDYNQLKAVDGNVYNSKLWVDMIFNKKITMDTNYRNHFSVSYYDSLINSWDEEWLCKEVMKHSVKDYRDAETIICYKNETCSKYNKLMCKHLGIKSMEEEGTTVICKTNDLRDKNLYNKFLCVVVSIEGEEIELTDGVSSYNIKREELFKNFDFGYARTIYSIQGESLDSYYYANEDLYLIYNRVAYTIISRLKTK